MGIFNLKHTMTIEGIKVDISLNTNSVKEYTNDLLCNLEKICNEMNTEAMSDYQARLEGRKEMLVEIIKYINKSL